MYKSLCEHTEMISTGNDQIDVYDGGISSSLTNSYVKKLVAIEGATLTERSISQNRFKSGPMQSENIRRFGHSPRYNPRTPSVCNIDLSASIAPVYWVSSTPAFMPATCIFRRRTSNGYVTVCDIDPVSDISTCPLHHQVSDSPARAPHVSFLGTVLLPGGVMIPRSSSYVAKFRPTYGATPTAVVIKPLYSARTPPSSRMTFNVMPHTVRSAAVKFATTAEDAADDTDAGLMGRDAVAMDSRDRTRSRGYVEPKNEEDIELNEQEKLAPTIGQKLATYKQT